MTLRNFSDEDADFVRDLGERDKRAGARDKALELAALISCWVPRESSTMPRATPPTHEQLRSSLLAIETTAATISGMLPDAARTLYSNAKRIRALL